MIEKVKLKEICRLINGRAYKQNELLASGKYPVLRVGNFFSDKDYYYSDLELEDDKYCDNGDLLFAWSASFGPKIWNGGKVIYHYHIWKMVLSDRVNRDYLFYYLYYLSERIKSEGHGGIMIHTTKAEMEEREFILPDLSHQKKISELFTMISNVIAMRKRELQKMDELIKARFVEMFGDMILNPNGLEKVLLGEVCDVRDGTHDSPKYYTEGYPLVTSKNVTGGRIDLRECSLICEDDYNKINQRSKVDVGDILMPMIGTVGNPVIVDIDAEFAIKNVALIKFKEDSRVINSFVKALLESDYFDRTVISKVRGGTQKFISLGDIRKFEICLPLIEMQEEFADFVKQVDKSKVAVQKALDETQLLFDSLMQKYFG